MMADYWASLRSSAIDGIEFDPKSRAVSGGHEFGRHRYQGRRGQDTEPTGGLPLTITLVIELFNTPSEPDNYPIKYNNLVNVLTDAETGGQVEYVDHLFGVLPMQVSTFSLDEAAERRNGGVITVTLEERSTDSLDLTVPIIVSRPGPRAIAAGRDIDQSLPAAGVFDEHTVAAFTSSGYPLSGLEFDYPPGELLARFAGDTVAGLTQVSASVDSVRGAADRARARVDAMLALPEIQTAEAWDTRRTLVLLSDSIEQCALEALARNGVESTIDAPPTGTTAHAIAKAVYGDPSRWLDVAASDGQIRNPLRIGSTTSGPLRVFVPKSRGARGRFS